MTTATVPLNDEALDLISDDQLVSNGPREFKPREPLFTEEQQRTFNRSFRKREAKLRAEYEKKLARLTVDLMDTTGLLQQLLSRSLDRLSPEDAAVIRRGIEEIRKEHMRTDARTN